MRWNRWARFGFAILAPVLVGVMLAAGAWAQEPVSSPPGGKASAPPAARPQGSPTPEHVRDVQQELANAGLIEIGMLVANAFRHQPAGAIEQPRALEKLVSRPHRASSRDLFTVKRVGQRGD